MTENRYIYAVEHPHGYFKIGRSKNPYDRVSGIQTGSPYELTFKYALVYMDVYGVPRAEKTVHDRLEKHQHSGEWFEVEDSTILRIFHEHMQHDELEGYRVVDVERRREQSSKIKTQEKRKRRPSL